MFKTSLYFPMRDLNQVTIVKMTDILTSFIQLQSLIYITYTPVGSFTTVSFQFSN